MENQQKEGNLIGNLITFAVSLILLCVVIWYGFWTIQPTKKPNDVDTQTQMAVTMNHLSNIAKDIHPSGSASIKEVQTYLTSQFEDMDVDYEAMSFRLNITEYTNYIIKLDAPGTDEGILFVSHYDSTTRGPGAVDDAISVASMLTTINQVKNRGEMTNDVYFLFTDGEEKGLIGAKGFMYDYYEQYKDIFKFVVNVEGRGNAGSLIMFETADNDYQAVRTLQKSVRSGSTPVSIAVALYKTMPNDTDFSVFLDKGFRGLNFSVVAGGENYHSEMDTIENLNHDTAFMYLSTVSELADYLENCNLAELDGEKDGVYFPISRGGFMLIEATVMNIITVISIVLFIGVIILAILKRRLSLKGILVDTALLSVLCGVTVLIAKPLDSLAMRLFERAEDPYQLADMKNIFFFRQMIIYAIVVFVFFFVIRRFICNKSSHLVLYGLVFLGACIALMKLFPEAVYLGSLPLLAISIVIITDVLWTDQIPIMGWIMSFLLCMVICTLTIPLVQLIYDTIGIFGEVSLVALVLGLVESVMLSLCTGTLVQNIVRTKRKRISD